MGEIADSILEGAFCEACGEYTGEDGVGPRRCAGCGDDDDDMKGVYAEMRSRGNAKRASNRESSPEILKREGISFYSNNGNVHCICQKKLKSGATLTADFWPGTGRFIVRGDPGMGKGRGVKDFGVFNLVKIFKGAK